METAAQRKDRHVMTEAETEVMLAHNNRCQGLPVMPEARRESMALLIL